MRNTAKKRNITAIRPLKSKFLHMGSLAEYDNFLQHRFNFVTEIFYITITFRHFSIDRTVQTYLDLMKEINEHQKSLERVKSDRTRWNTVGSFN